MTASPDKDRGGSGALPSDRAFVPTASSPQAVSGVRDAQAYLDDPRHLSPAPGGYQYSPRHIMDQHFARARIDAVAVARDCFLNMIADAERWDEDVDGDCDGDGRPVMYINYDLRIGHSQLQELCEVLGIEARGYCETLKDAIDRAVDEPAASAIEARRAETAETGSVHESAVGECRDAQ